MIKKITIMLVFLSFFSCSCSCKKINQNDDIERFYLNNSYYDNGEFIKLSSDNFINYQNGSYLLYIYNNYCALAIPCENIFRDFMKKYQISFLSMPFEEFKKSSFYNQVRYAPTIIIVENGEIRDFLDANSDSDLSKYQDILQFESWLNNYIYFSKKE